MILLQRFGYHFAPTVIVLGLNAPLDAASAENLANYRITGPTGRRIGIRSVVYEAASQTVIIRPSQLLNIHWNYLLQVNGSTATGVRGEDGALLEGAGLPGTDFRAIINRSTLVLPSAIVTAAVHPRGPAARPFGRLYGQRYTTRA